MYLSSRIYVTSLLYLIVFIGAMGVQFPFYNIFTVAGVNLFLVPYIFLVLFIFAQIVQFILVYSKSMKYIGFK